MSEIEALRVLRWYAQTNTGVTEHPTERQENR